MRVVMWKIRSTSSVRKKNKNKKSFLTLIILFVYMQICVWHSWLCVCVRLLPYCTVCIKIIEKNIQQYTQDIIFICFFSMSFIDVVVFLFSSKRIYYYVCVCVSVCFNYKIIILFITNENHNCISKSKFIKNKNS